MCQVLAWDDYFMNIAQLSAYRSKDPSRKVGCCLVDEESKRILSIGYNGFPRGCSDQELPWGKEGEWLDTKYPYVVHAEANAILNSSSSLKNAVAYVTLFPCNECAKLMIQAGIKKVFFLENINDAHVRKAVERMFALADINVSQLPLQTVMKLEQQEL